MKDPQNT